MTRPHETYQPKNELYLWWLGRSDRPALVGDLHLVGTQRGVGLRYADSWVEHGFSLSEDLPLLSQREFIPTERDTAAGAVDDARPDRWGERVIRFLDRPSRLSLLEYLYFAGDDRFGALGVSVSRTQYEPRRFGPLPILEDTDQIHELVQRVLVNEPVPAELKRLVSPGVTMGGAKPKALIAIDGHPWIVKFGDGDPVDITLVEHASMTLAANAGIRVAETRPIRLSCGHAVAVRRFDRDGNRRLHLLSAHVALRAAGEPYGYPELAQILRRRGIVEGDIYREHMRELFRRMVFNILIDNTDDHEKNHALLVNDAQQFELSLAYDILPSGQALGYQQMRVGEAAGDSTLDNALSLCAMFELRKSEAQVEIQRVSTAISRWRSHFASCGVTHSDIELLAEQIDRPFLLDQRKEFSRH